MAKDNSLRFYLNPEAQKDLLVILLDMEAQGVPGITNADGKLIQSAGLQEFIRRRKDEMQQQIWDSDDEISYWEFYKSMGRLRGLIVED